MHVETWVYFSVFTEQGSAGYCLQDITKKKKKRFFCREEVGSHQKENGSDITHPHQQIKFHLH